ncbi:unnamed protein product [Amoebophrya sp. A25]|nr:unnamed protein product [Amoebophrya sp. A25]|eukprot:GSA25T00024489001.1
MPLLLTTLSSVVLILCPTTGVDASRWRHTSSEPAFELPAALPRNRILGVKSKAPPTSSRSTSTTTSEKFGQEHRKLLVCNAVPEWSGVTLQRNNISPKKNALLHSNNCRFIRGALYEGDRIGFNFQKEEAKGSFEVRELPKGDSVLLLIVQKRLADPSSKLLAFQSFGFSPAAESAAQAVQELDHDISVLASGKALYHHQAPTTSPAHRPDAQVAFLDAVAEDRTDGSLWMADARKRGKATREERVFFNRVYGIAGGEYEVRLAKTDGSTEARDSATNNGEKGSEVLTKKLRLTPGKDYVVLKTGTQLNSSLVVFPDDAAMDPGDYHMFAMLQMIAIAGPIAAAGYILHSYGAFKWPSRGARAVAP